MEPLRSANSTVTCLRSPSRALRDVKIFLGEVSGGVCLWRQCGRRGGRRGGWERGACIAHPQHALLFLQDRIPVSIAQLGEEISQGILIELKLPLEGTIGHTAALAQQGDHLIHDRDKVHPVPPCDCVGRRPPA